MHNRNFRQAAPTLAVAATAATSQAQSLNGISTYAVDALWCFATVSTVP